MSVGHRVEGWEWRLYLAAGVSIVETVGGVQGVSREPLYEFRLSVFIRLKHMCARAHTHTQLVYLRYFYFFVFNLFCRKSSTSNNLLILGYMSFASVILFILLSFPMETFRSFSSFFLYVCMCMDIFVCACDCTQVMARD